MEGRLIVSCILAIYDNDTDYANHLMDYIKRKKKKISQVRVFTNHNSLKEYLEHNKINILLLDEKIPPHEVEHENIKNICILSEGSYIREGSTCTVIYKYQSAELIIQEVFSYFAAEIQAGRPLEKTWHKAKLISVFSVRREKGQSMIALSLAASYARNKKTLYINLDIFQAFSEIQKQNTEKGLSEFIYYLKQNHPNLMNKMNELITRFDQFDYIQGVNFGPDLYELTTDDMTLWMNELRNNNEYEVIIFDVGTFFQATLELFCESNELLLILGDNDWEQSRYHNFKNQLLWVGFEEVLQKIRIITYPQEQPTLKSFSDTSNDYCNRELLDLIAPYVEDERENDEKWN